ncbi:SDR family oxidoreductase [Defluviimonas sp. WL0002]|uniref:SDR family oxidoreductase n=1 Tax=Albidovulum marisflavi TaxID=2984159 RepID=A0ABT2ZFB8_9RHOB|nr:SDR family oxidoreductase [Defluviimonas sp. WL0002]MCV2869819.1 SDR family oxidoreductase [Defluviimonas sp. WL0002]
MTDIASDPATARVALVTGASRGLGFALAAALAHAGWHVIAVARTVGGLEELDDRIQAAGGQATLAPMDVTDDKAMTHLAQSIAGRWGGLGLWVHAAIHAAPLAPAGSLDLKDLDKSLATNVRATAGLIPLIEPLLRVQGGTALFLDDPRSGEKFFGAYGATKAAQIALAQSWQAETARVGPRVLIETPQPMATATRARFFPGEDRTPLADIHGEAARLLAKL